MILLKLIVARCLSDCFIASLMFHYMYRASLKQGAGALHTRAIFNYSKVKRTATLNEHASQALYSHSILI